MHERLQVPLAMLLVSALLQVLLVGSMLLMFLLSALSTVFSVAVDGSNPEMLMIQGGMLMWRGLLKVPQATLLLSGLLSARAAFHIYEPGELTAVRLGSAAAFIGPLIALFTNFLAILSFDCCGLVFGGLARFVIVVIGLVAWLTTLQALDDPDVSVLFDAGEDREDAFLRS